MKEEFEDTKGVIRIRKSKKNRQHNGQKKKDKRTNNDLQNIHIQCLISTLDIQCKYYNLFIFDFIYIIIDHLFILYTYIYIFFITPKWQLIVYLYLAKFIYLKQYDVKWILTHNVSKYRILTTYVNPYYILFRK